MPHALFARSAQIVHSGLLQARASCAAHQAVSTQWSFISRAAFASAADAATKKEGSEAKKEAKKSALETALSGLKTIVTSRAAVLAAGGACLLIANVQSGNLIEEHYKKQVVQRVSDGFCPEPQPAGPGHVPRLTVVQDLDRILMQDQPSKFYYVITGAHGRGKSTLLREMCLRRGVKGMGYIEVEPYPKNFGRALGTALNFHFQEHMGMLKQLVGLTGALPVSEEDTPQTTLKRAAGALEEAAREYKKRTGRPFVLVIDAVDRLAEHCPDLLATFQDYCKDWAEQLIVSVVLVCSESKAPQMLRGRDAWSHAYQPGEITNLYEAEAVDYLVQRGVDKEDARELYQVTDGVFQRLEKCVVMLARGMSLQQVKDSVLQDVESYFCTAGLLDDTPQQKPGLRVIRELVKPPTGVLNQLFAGADASRGRLSISAAEFRQLVPHQQWQDKLLNSAAVFSFDGTALRFESRTSEAYARDILPGKISPDIKI